MLYPLRLVHEERHKSKSAAAATSGSGGGREEVHFKESANDHTTVLIEPAAKENGEDHQQARNNVLQFKEFTSDGSQSWVMRYSK